MTVRGIGGRRAAAAVATIFVLVVSLLDVALAAPADAAIPGVTVDARVDGKRVGESTETRPIRLAPKKTALLVVEVSNNSRRPIDVRIVRLEGKVVGLTFFAYDTAVAMTVAPGAKGSRRFPLDLGGLDGQATGLIPGSVKLLDPDRHVVAEEAGVMDVRGSLLSVYGLFGVGIAILTIVSFLGALIGLARHRLPPNRWRRALRFMTPGVGVGLLINFTLSATRVFVPGVGRWLTIVVVSAAVFFGLGYLTPTPPVEEEEEEEEALALPASPVAPELAAPPVAPALEQPPDAPELDAPTPQRELELPDEPPAEADAVELGEWVEAAPATETVDVAEPVKPAPVTETVWAAPATPPAPVTETAEPAPVTETVHAARATPPAPVTETVHAARATPPAPATETVESAQATEAVPAPATEATGGVPSPPPPERLPIVVSCYLPPESPETEGSGLAAPQTVAVPPPVAPAPPPAPPTTVVPPVEP